MTWVYLLENLFLILKKRNVVGSLFTMQYTDFKKEEWKITQGTLVIYESLKDNSVIKITDIENKIHKISFRLGGKFIVDKIEGKFKLFWNDKDLV